MGRLVRLIAFSDTCHGTRLREVGWPARPGPTAAHEWEPRAADALRPGLWRAVAGDATAPGQQVNWEKGVE